MDSNDSSVSPAAASSGILPLLIALLAAPLIWAFHLALSYFLVALDCGTTWNGGRLGVVIVTIGCALAGIATGIYGWRGWRDMREARARAEVTRPQTREFFLLGGVVLAALFTAALILGGLSPLLLPMCA